MQEWVHSIALHEAPAQIIHSCGNGPCTTEFMERPTYLVEDQSGCYDDHKRKHAFVDVEGFDALAHPCRSFRICAYSARVAHAMQVFHATVVPSHMSALVTTPEFLTDEERSEKHGLQEVRDAMNCGAHNHDPLQQRVIDLEPAGRVQTACERNSTVHAASTLGNAPWQRPTSCSTNL